MNYCDNCNAPMAHVVHHSAESCAYGDTDQCVVCTTIPGLLRRSDLIDEINALGPHMGEDGVANRIIELSDMLKGAR